MDVHRIPEPTPYLETTFALRVGETAAGELIREVEETLGGRAPAVSLDCLLADVVTAAEVGMELLLALEHQSHPAEDLVLVLPLFETMIPLWECLEKHGLVADRWKAPGRPAAFRHPGVRAGVLEACEPEARGRLVDLVSRAEAQAAPAPSFYRQVFALGVEHHWLYARLKELPAPPQDVADLVCDVYMDVMKVRTEQDWFRNDWWRLKLRLLGEGAVGAAGLAHLAAEVTLDDDDDDDPEDA
jgi:hypothetical protein